jgi:hypothetical protein
MCDLLERSCQEVGVTYVKVPWEEKHCQESFSTATPAKHFNEGGVALWAKLISSENEKVVRAGEQH